MITAIIGWTYIFFLSFGIAWYFKLFVEYLFQKSAHRDAAVFPEIFSVIGLSILVFFLSLISLFDNIGIATHIISIPFLFTFIFRKPRQWLWRQFTTIKLNQRQQVLMIITFPLLLFLSSGYPYWGDVGFYHMQAIQWIEDFGVIKGLGNIHGRLAFNPQSQLLFAFFNFRELFSTPLYHLVPGYFTIMTTFFLIRKMSFKYLDIRSIIYGGVFIYYIYTYLNQFSAPIPGTLVTSISVFVFMYLFEKGEYEILPKQLFYLAPVVFILLTLKLAAAPMVLLMGIVVFSRKSFNVKYLIYIIIAGVILITPYLLRNYYLSGYLVYPVAFMKVDAPEWQIPEERVIDEKKKIEIYARLNKWDWKNIPYNDFSYWFPRWLKLDGIPNFSLLGAGIIFSMIALGRIFYKRKFLVQDFVFIVTVIGVAFWFITAPDFRFAYGFLWPFTFIGFYYTVQWVKYLKILDYLPRILFPLILVFIIAVPVFKMKGKPAKEFSDRIFFPLKLEVPDYHLQKVSDDFSVKVPDNKRGYCWDLPYPCVNDSIRKVDMIGDEYSDGFKYTGNNEND